MLEQYVTINESIIPHPDSKVRKTLHDFKSYMLKHKETQTVSVDPRYSYPETHNFYAYCSLMNYAPIQIYPIMILNGLENPMDFTPEIKSLIVPSATCVAEIIATITN